MRKSAVTPSRNQQRKTRYFLHCSREWIIKGAALLALASCLSACSNFQLPGVYRLVIQQGNIITQEMVDQLQPGMTKRQVNYVLGTPLIMDSFHADRWDYMYTIRDQDGETRQQRLTVHFQDDKLTHFDGDFHPSVASDQQGSDDNS